MRLLSFTFDLVWWTRSQRSRPVRSYSCHDSCS